MHVRMLTPCLAHSRLVENHDSLPHRDYHQTPVAHGLLDAARLWAKVCLLGWRRLVPPQAFLQRLLLGLCGESWRELVWHPHPSSSSSGKRGNGKGARTSIGQLLYTDHWDSQPPSEVRDFTRRLRNLQVVAQLVSEEERGRRDYTEGIGTEIRLFFFQLQLTFNVSGIQHSG